MIFSYRIAALGFCISSLAFASLGCGDDNSASSPVSPSAVPQLADTSSAPGLIQTDMTKDMQSCAIEAMKEEAFLKRLGVPEDIAQAIAFLASDRASFVSGQTFVVDGGRVTIP